MAEVDPIRHIQPTAFPLDAAFRVRPTGDQPGRHREERSENEAGQESSENGPELAEPVEDEDRIPIDPESSDHHVRLDLAV